jgi:hypothetical protein
MSFERFNQIITQMLEHFGEAPTRSSNKVPKRSPLVEGTRREYWLEGSNTKAHWDSGRTAAYLAAYVTYSGSATFSAQGIRVAEGYIHPDKGVVCSLLVGGCISFEEGQISLTEKGQALIAPFVRLAGSDVG